MSYTEKEKYRIISITMNLNGLRGRMVEAVYGECEGKDGKGIFHQLYDFSTDLHSMGQYVQEGRRILLETSS